MASGKLHSVGVGLKRVVISTIGVPCRVRAKWGDSCQGMGSLFWEEGKISQLARHRVETILSLSRSELQGGTESIGEVDLTLEQAKGKVNSVSRTVYFI